MRASKALLLCSFLLFSCANRNKINSVPALRTQSVYTQRYSYAKIGESKWVIIALSEKDKDEALRRLNLGPAIGERWIMWIIRPLTRKEIDSPSTP